MAYFIIEKATNKYGIGGWQYRLMAGGDGHLMTSHPNWYRYKRDARRAIKTIIESIAKYGLS